MKLILHTTLKGITACALAVIFHPATLLAQGPLTPPGAPAPTMKTLDQVEPRVDVATLPGNATYEHIISQPGSYYLSANIATAKTTAILISAAGVTLDLNGFQISRSAGTGGVGVHFGVERITIRNGTIAGAFASGVNGASAVPPSTGALIENLAISGCSAFGIFAEDSAVVRNCRVHDGTGIGIQAGPGATVSHCTVADWAGSRGIFGTFGTTINHCTVTRQTGLTGIEVQSGGVITDCTVYDCAVTTAALRGEGATTIARSTAYSNDTPIGISCGNGGTISHCAARSNTSTIAASSGISAASGSTVIACSADENTSTAGTLTGATGAGIVANTNVSVFDCTVRSNLGDGIRAAGGCHIRGNTCNNNGALTGDGAGIHATNSDARIESNTLISNDRGLDVDVAGNFIARNTASNNAVVNYDIVANNAVGTIVQAPNSLAISGSTGGAGVGSTDPWANFSY